MLVACDDAISKGLVASTTLPPLWLMAVVTIVLTVASALAIGVLLLRTREPISGASASSGTAWVTRYLRDGFVRMRVCVCLRILD